ncbi:MAG: starch-binding protein, partial [Spirochaetales bacterium]|nr:starch-binding protein [Spirochaetales bacterium]
TTLYYMYTVSGGDDKENIGITKNTYPNNVQDVGGNVLVSGMGSDAALKYDGKGIIIDTVCTPPVLSGVEKDEVYNTSKSVTLTGEDGASLWYSTDGGATENELVGNSFTTSNVEGRYQLTGYQIDFAGNKSLWASAIEIVIDTAKPTIKSISTTAGDGIYKTGDTITITAEFSEVVSGDIEVPLNCSDKASVTMNVSNSNNATATYKVAAGDDTKKLAVSKTKVISGTITDTAKNVVNSFSGFSNFDGKNIVIDTVTPTLTDFKVTKYKENSATESDVNAVVQDVDIGTDIVLIFNERVSKGTGTVTVERVYKSYPAVMETDEYNTHSASISDYYIQRCIGTVDNEGTAPDTDAKYVLKYEIDHGAYETNGSLNGDQKAVYDYFKDKDYNVTKIDVNSSLITEKADESSGSYSFVTIKLPSKLKKGIIYKVTFTAGTFVDQAGNACAAVTGTDVSFETGPTATPVIRINKISGSGSGNQPYTTGVKVSSEMHGAKLSLGKTSNKVTCDNNKPSKVADPNPTSFSEYSGAITISTASSALGEIFKLWAKTTKDGLTAGEVCKELAFKTVIGLGGSSHYVRGSDSTGGVSATTEFPASWYESLSTAQGGNSCWVTWHILKSFQWKEYDPNASHNNDTDNRWIGSENEVTKPGSYDSINATEIVDGSGVSGTVKVIVPSSYEYTHIYYWNCNNSSYTSSWPGLKMPLNGSNYEFIFENTSKVNIIFNKGGNGQTGDLSIGSSGTYKFNGSSLTKQ